MADDTLIYKGSKHTFRYGVTKNGEMPAKDFLNTLRDKEKNHFVAIFRMVADGGIEQEISKKKFRKERDFFGAKHDSCKNGPGGKKLARIVCFRHGSQFVVMFGFWKSGSCWKEQVFDQAKRLKPEMEQHISLKSTNEEKKR